jgi:hypothetical protein
MTIDLSRTDPRDYLHEIERCLTIAGYIAVVEALHGKRARDLMEVWVELPEDVEIKLWEVAP